MKISKLLIVIMIAFTAIVASAQITIYDAQRYSISAGKVLKTGKDFPKDAFFELSYSNLDGNDVIIFVLASHEDETLFVPAISNKLKMVKDYKTKIINGVNENYEKRGKIGVYFPENGGPQWIVYLSPIYRLNVETPHFEYLRVAFFNPETNHEEYTALIRGDINKYPEDSGNPLPSMLRFIDNVAKSGKIILEKSTVR